MGRQLTLTDTLLGQLGPAAPVLGSHSWEVGRLVLATEYRSDVEVLRRCLFLALSYAHTHAQVQDLYASCTHVLSRLYRRFGFSILASDIPLAGTDKRYTLIHGSAPQALKSLAGLR